mmetsp:Transcript_1909/g.11702  ORF Transcript_1909/g.11702 Transcript_1909/m.11702 type:complete len:249 (+) Transcript_1909:6455-7201(+)
MHARGNQRTRTDDVGKKHVHVPRQRTRMDGRATRGRWVRGGHAHRIHAYTDGRTDGWRWYGCAGHTYIDGRTEHGRMDGWHVDEPCADMEHPRGSRDRRGRAFAMDVVFGVHLQHNRSDTQSTTTRTWKTSIARRTSRRPKPCARRSPRRTEHVRRVGPGPHNDRRKVSHVRFDDAAPSARRAAYAWRRSDVDCREDASCDRSASTRVRWKEVDAVRGARGDGSCDANRAKRRPRASWIRPSTRCFHV